jgi:CheY-like chemotaxis protein
MKNTNHTSKQTIIWVDDDPDDIYLIRQVLKESQYDVNLVNLQNGKEVIDMLSSTPRPEFPCLIVLDINMPVMDGKQTLSFLKRNKEMNSIPVVMFSTSDSPTDKMFCQHFGSQLITKPSTYTALKHSVESLLKRCTVSAK